MGLGYAHGTLGHIDKAMECIQKLEQRQIEGPDFVIDTDLVAVWLGVGNFDKVFYHIRKCIEKRTLPIISVSSIRRSRCSRGPEIS